MQLQLQFFINFRATFSSNSPNNCFSGNDRYRQFVLPSEFFAGDDGVVVGERFVVDGGFDFGQEATDAAALVRFGCWAMQEAGSASRVPGAWTFGDHDRRLIGAVG